MLRKRIVILTLILTCFILASGVSASDDVGSHDSGENITFQNNVLKESDQSFSQLNEKINGNNYDEIYLESNYKYCDGDDSFKEGIVIKRNLTVCGNGHTVDGSGKARIFKVDNANVVFRNITFMGGNVTGSGGAIYGACQAVNCTFINNTATNGGAVSLVDAINCTFIDNLASLTAGGLLKGSAKNCIFINNSAGCWGGAVSGANAINCFFKNNSGIFGGAINAANAVNCTFIDCCGEYGGAMYGDSSATYFGINCTFINNSAIGETSDGGAMCYVNAVGCRFISNSAGRDAGGMIYGDARNCTFINNTANRFGGAMSGDVYDVFDSKFINNSAFNGGALYKSDAFNCTFINNSATSFGGGVFNSVVINSTFEYNRANKGGAVSGTRVSNCIFNYNSANEYGGAVNDAKVSTNSNFNNNTAKTGKDTYNVDFFEIKFTKSFNDLNSLINDNDAGDIYLDCDYAFNPISDGDYKQGIKINREVTIHGNGFSIDAFNLARIFNVGTWVILKDIIFTNGYAWGDFTSSNGGAVSGSKCTVINCTFINNSASDYGGATFYVDAVNCTYINNYAFRGGAAYGGDFINSTFINNTAFYGTAIVGSGTNDVINCTIINTESNNKNAFNNVNEQNCTFINNKNPMPKYILTVSSLNSTYGLNDSLFFNFTTSEGDIILDANIKITAYKKYPTNIAKIYYALSDKNSVAVDIDAGEYLTVVSVTNYIVDEVNTTIKIAKAPTKINLTSCDGISGKPIILNITANVTCEVSLWVGSTNKRVKVNANELTSVDMGVYDAGRYHISAEIYGLNFIKSREDKYIKIYGKIDEESVNVSEIVYGDEIIINNLPDDAKGNITLTIAGADYVGDLSEGRVIFKIPKFEIGSYPYNLTYSGDGIYLSFTKSGSINVSDVIPTSIEAYSLNTVYNSGYYLVLTLKDIHGNVIGGEGLSVSLNGKVLTPITDAKGQVKVPVSTLPPKAYLLTATFSGNVKYVKCEKSVNIVVKKATPKLIASKKTFKKSVKTKKYTITFKDPSGKVIAKAKFTLKVKGKTYNAKTNKNGKATFKIKNLKKKTKVKATVKFAGNTYYNGVVKKVKIIVK